MELAEQLLVGARPLAELAIRRGVGAQAEQVVHARRVVGDEGQVVVGAAGAHVVGTLPRLAPQDLLAIEARGPRRHVRLQADDRLDARVLAVRVKVEGAEKVPVIRQADRGLAEARGFFRHRFRLRRSVEHRILGVVVKVHERISHASILLSTARATTLNAPRRRSFISRLDALHTRPRPGSGAPPCRVSRAGDATPRERRRDQPDTGWTRSWAYPCGGGRSRGARRGATGG